MSDTKEMQRVPAEWTPDCQGKWDFDGNLVTLSTRYWPRGGGFHIRTADGEWEGNEHRPEMRPSAHATIYLGSTDNDHYDAAEMLADMQCDGETEADVKRRVEIWATVQFCRIQAALRREFATVQPVEAGKGSVDETQ